MSRRWQYLLNNAIDGIYPALNAMTDAELKLVRSAPKKMTTSNCWWLAYELAPHVADIADGILKCRSAARRVAKLAQEGPKP